MFGIFLTYNCEIIQCYKFQLNCWQNINTSEINTSLQKSEMQTKLEQVLIFPSLLHVMETDKEKMRHVVSNNNV